MGTLSLNADDAVVWGAKHPDWYIFPGALLPDGSGGWRKQPLVRWTTEAVRAGDSDAVKALWKRSVGAGKAVVCVACEPSGIWVLDDDRDLAPDTGWPDRLEALIGTTLVLRSCTKARPHYVFRVGPDGARPKEGTWLGGDVKATGIVFLSDEDPISDLPPTVAPDWLLERLGGAMVTVGGGSREAVSSEEMWEWLTSFDDDDLLLTGAGPERFLHTLLDRFEDEVASGEHRRQACLKAVWAAVKEAASGFFLPDEAYRQLRDTYREMRDSDGSWTKPRQRDFDLMWAGAIAQVLAGDFDADIAANVERVGADGDLDDEVAEVLAALNWLSEPDEEPEDAPEEPEDARTLRWGVEVAEPPAASAMEAWRAPEGLVQPLISAAGEPPKLADDSILWSTPQGTLARAMAEVVEVSAEAMLSALLVWSGAHLAGRGTHYIAGAVHNPVVWAVLVGRSAAARKSTAQALAEGVVYGFPGEGSGRDLRLWEAFVPRRVSGFNSGEVMIDGLSPPERVGDDDDDDDDGSDVNDFWNPRAVWVEPEMDRLWTAAGRDGSTMATMLCAAWDGATLSVASRTHGAVEVSGDAYALGVLGSATVDRAIAALGRGEGQMVHSGLANRFLWCLLPDDTIDLPFSDGTLPWSEIATFREALGLRLVHSEMRPVLGPEISLSAGARDLWAAVYGWLKRGSKECPGELGAAALGRAEAQVRRLGLLFCGSRGGGEISVDDLSAALALWEHNRASVRWLLAPERQLEAPGRLDSDVKGQIHAWLADPTGPGWATLAGLADALDARKGSVQRPAKALADAGVLRSGTARTSGRPQRVYGLAARVVAGALGERGGGRVPLSSVVWD